MCGFQVLPVYSEGFQAGPKAKGLGFQIIIYFALLGG